MDEEDVFYGHENHIAVDLRIGFMYFIVAPELNRIKIGITTQTMTERLKGLQTGSPTPLTIAAYCRFQNYFAVEKKLHILFKEVNCKVGGRHFSDEWFDGADLLWGFIWEYADKIVNPSVFPERFLRRSSDSIYKSDLPKSLKYIMQTKGRVDWEDMEEPLIAVHGIIPAKDYVSYSKGLLKA